VIKHIGWFRLWVLACAIVILAPDNGVWLSSRAELATIAILVLSFVIPEVMRLSCYKVLRFNWQAKKLFRVEFLDTRQALRPDDPHLSFNITFRKPMTVRQVRVDFQKTAEGQSEHSLVRFLDPVKELNDETVKANTTKYLRFPVEASCDGWKGYLAVSIQGPSLSDSYAYWQQFKIKVHRQSIAHQ